MGFGTFDGVHAGHMDFFRQLKDLGDKLCIVVGRDKNVEKIKCRPPKQKEKDRYGHLQEIKLIDQVILGNKDDFYKCIAEHKPDIIGIGYDQRADMNYLEDNFPHIKVIRLAPFKPEKYKSSLRNQE